MRQPLFLCTLALVLLASSAAQAQIVNIQPLLGERGQPGFSLEATGYLELRSGNVDLFVGRAGLLMSYLVGRHRIISSSSAELGIKNDAEYLNNTFTHLRYQYYATDWLAWETWLQGATNRFKRLNFRALAGTGPRFDLARGDRFTCALGVHYMLEYEELREPSGQTDEELTELNHRANTYFTFSWDILPQLALTETVYFQPLFRAPLDDFRVSNEVQLTAKVTDHLGLGTNFQVAYDSDPPDDVETVDTALLATLTVAL